jgi:hypothetical protein
MMELYSNRKSRVMFLRIFLWKTRDVRTSWAQVWLVQDGGTSPVEVQDIRHHHRPRTCITLLILCVSDATFNKHNCSRPGMDRPPLSSKQRRVGCMFNFTSIEGTHHALLDKIKARFAQF